MKYANPRPSQFAIAADIWEEIKTASTPSDRWLGNYFHQHRRRFGSRDRKFYSETIYALFRHRLFLESWAHFLGQSHVQFLVLLALITEQILPAPLIQEELTRVFPKNLISFENFSKISKASELPPDICERISSEEERLSFLFSFPLWLVEKWKNQFGEETAKELLKASQRRPPFCIRTNPLKISRENLLKRFEEQGFKVSPSPQSRFGIYFEERKNLFDSPEFREGLFEIQDEGSQLICQWIDPKPGEVVWDVCAGGGGKSLLLAALMQNKGRIIATDIRERKLDELRKRAKRAGVMNIFPAELGRIAESRDIKKGVDRIVVDAPCSGTGTLRRNPDAKWKLRPDVFKKNHEDQTAIISGALPYLKPGGRLYYVTCSLEPEENERVMDEICEKNPFLQKESLPDFPEGVRRLFPHLGGTDGFFLAIVRNKN